MSDAHTRYVAGFLFKKRAVLLIRKTRPEWQDGLLNGIGGKVEPGELPRDAMAREFEEETGLKTLPADWTEYCVEQGSVYTVHFFKRRVHSLGGTELRPVNDVGERLCWVNSRRAAGFYPDVVGNLRWLIPMALDWRQLVVSVRALDNIAEKPSWE